MGQEQKTTTYHVTLDTGTDGIATYQVTAAYVKTDDHFFPGFVQLFDEDKNLVALALSSRALLVCRREADPTRTPRPNAPTAPVPRPPTARKALATPADLAPLAALSGKPGAV